MSTFHGFDPKTLTDAELLEKQTELNRKVVWASRFSSGDVVGQLQQIIAAIEFERRERSQEIYLRARAAAPAVLVESDPDLAAENYREVEAEQARMAPKPTSRPKPFPITRERMKITRTPMQDDDDATTK